MNTKKSYRIFVLLATLIILVLALSACNTQQQEDLAGTGGGGLPIADGEYTDRTPIVVSITRADQNPTIAQELSFNVTFLYVVSGVDVTDFQITSSQSLIGAKVIDVSSTDGITYTVTINRGNLASSDDIGLDLIDDNTIKDSEGKSLGGENLNDGDFTSGEKYTILISTPIP